LWGAGLGGLTAVAVPAHMGMDVTALEAHAYTG
jgi:phytoene dehydrogenase-like protein